jgi:PilZ domain-containing protein
MLELNDGKMLMEKLWEMASTKVDPNSLGKDFFALHGPAQPMGHNNRAYHRHYMRGKAVLKRGDTVVGAYTKDVSRQGIGFLSPVQLLPKEQVKLQLPVAELNLEITRCRRLEKECFECGAKFVLGRPVSEQQ